MGLTANVRQGSLHLYIDDLFDGQPGTFAFGNPFSIRSVRQYTPARPRGMTLSASHRF
ncbi:MAG: hypothetical protein V4564_15520 [Pseudomonadota bacterium]